MKFSFNQIKRHNRFGSLEKLEFWLATGLFALAVTAVFSERATESGRLFGLNYLYDLLLFSVLYTSFLLMNFLVIPGIHQKNAIWGNVAITAFIIAASFALFPRPEQNFILAMLAGYFVFKFAVIFSWRGMKTFRAEKGSFYTGILLAVAFYLLLMFFLFIGDAEKFAIGLPGILIPFAILLYSYSSS